jgi:hypothetical protein
MATVLTNSQNMSLTTGNLVATCTSANGFSLSSRVLSSSKIYFEFTPQVLAGTASVGIICWGGNTGQLVGYDNYGIGYRNTGAVVLNGTVLKTLATYAVGNTIGVAINLGLRLIWFTLDGVTWNNDVNANQNPVGNVGGISYSSANVATAYAGFSLNTTNDRLSAAFTAGTTTYTPPTGYTSPDVSTISATKADPVVNTGSQMQPLQLPLGGVAQSPYQEDCSALFIPGGPILHVSGIVTENGQPVQRTIRGYNSATGKLVSTTTSNPLTGVFVLPANSAPALDVVAKDDPNFQAQIFNGVIPT